MIKAQIKAPPYRFWDDSDHYSLESLFDHVTSLSNDDNSEGDWHIIPWGYFMFFRDTETHCAVQKDEHGRDWHKTDEGLALGEAAINAELKRQGAKITVEAKLDTMKMYENEKAEIYPMFRVDVTEYTGTEDKGILDI